MSDRASDSSRPKPKKTLNELGLNLSQADDKTTVEPNSSKLPRTPFVRKDFLEGKNDWRSRSLSLTNFTGTGRNE